MCKITKENDSLQRQTENKDEDSHVPPIKKNVPELRFPEFKGEWNSYKISEISKTYSGGTPSTSNREFYKGNIPFIKSGEINSETTEQYINEDAISNSSAKYVKKGDLLLALYGATSGEVAISKIDGAINQAVLKIDNKMNNIFQYNYFLKYKNRIVFKYVQGGQGNLSAKIIKNLQFKYPSDEEQKKIANFLTYIDKKIGFMEKKLNFWKKLKKYYITRILNHTSEYKIRNVENIIKVIGSKKYQIKKTEIKNKGKYVVVDQSKDYVAGFHNDKNKVFFDIPIIIFGDHTTVLKYIEKPFIVGGDGVKILKPKIDINLKYLYYNLISNNIHSEGYKRHFGILKKKDIKIINDKKIQKTIGDLLYNIDRIIKYRSSKLKQLKYFKKGLLQKMFC